MLTVRYALEISAHIFRRDSKNVRDYVQRQLGSLPIWEDTKELLELQQVERIRERLDRELKQATDRENEIKRRAARLDTLEADKAALEGLDETTMSDQLKVLKNSMLSMHAHVDSRLDFMQNSLDQILDLLQRPGFRPAAQSPLPLTAMSSPFPVQAGTQPRGTSAAVSQTVASSSSGSAMVATPPQQLVPQQGQQQGQWYPKTPMKPPLAFSREKKDEELNTWLRTVPVWVKAKRTLQEEEVITAASYLEGKAAKWLDGLVSKAGDECKGAFKRLKHALMNHEVLMVPDPQKPFIVITDASQYDIGTVLAQQDGKKLRPIEYMSKKMPSKKLAKSTYERELYALYKALVHWRHFLLGRFFYLRIDHQTLKWIKTQPALCDALKRWIEVIDQYDFKLEYLKGEYNKVADALSRRADYLGALVSEFGVSQEVTQSLVGAYQEDPVMMDIMHKLQAKDKATKSEFVMMDGLLFLDKVGCKRLVVPSSESLRSLFLGKCHDASGHFGYKKTSANLVQRFWWPKMLDDAKKYVETCQVCQRDKPRTQAPLGLLKPLPIPAGPGQSVSMDFMDTVVTSKSGKRHIFVIIDRFTKYARLIAMPETARTDHVIKLFMDNWVRDFGLPKSIVSDRDVRFTSELWKKTAEQMGSQLQMTSRNHPEANGQAEQMNKVVQHLLRHYIKPSQDDWDEKLPLIASLYNNAVHSSTGVSPNQLHLGWKPRSALDFLLPENRPSATPGTLEYGVQYVKLLQQVVEHIKNAQQAMIASRNKHRRQSSFQIGEHVWVKASELGQEFGISRKLMPQYFGPWEVLDIVRDEMDGPTYVIRIPGHLRTHPVFHASKLAPFIETDQFPSRRSMLPPTMDGQVDIDDIVDHRDLPVPKPLGRGRPPKPKWEYRVRFRHHTDPKEDRWFTREERIDTAPQAVADYERMLKGKAPAKKEAQDLQQRHEAASIERLKYWHFEPSEGHDDATPEEQHKEFTAKLMTKMVYAINHLESELANLQRAMRTYKAQHEDATRALDSRMHDLEQAAPGPQAGESSSAPSNRQLEERVDHVVAMLGDISTSTATATISQRLDVLDAKLGQQQQPSDLSTNNSAKPYKMSTFRIEKFDDYTHKDLVVWWQGFTTELGIHEVPKHLFISTLFLNTKGGCQIWLSHMANIHGVQVSDLYKTVPWEVMTKEWKKRFIVDDAPALAINRIFAMAQGSTPTRDWLTDWQKIVATPDLDLPFTHLCCEFYNRSCAALSLALGDHEQYTTFVEIINKAREVIKTNRPAAHENSTWQPIVVEKVKTGPRPQHVAAVQTDSGEDPTATQATTGGYCPAAKQQQAPRKREGENRIAGRKQTASTMVPAPLMDAGVEVVDLHAYIAKIDREFKTQREAVSFDILDTKFDMISGMSWLRSEDHSVNFYRRIVHIRDRNRVLVPCTVPPPHPSISCHVVSAASMRASIIRDDIEEMGGCFLHALPPHDASPTDSSSDPRITELLDAYGDVFEGPHGVVPDQPIHHEIILEDGAVPSRGCIYRMSEEELSVLRAQLDDLLEKGWIRPSSSPYGAPVLFVRKKNKDLRLCIDSQAQRARLDSQAQRANDQKRRPSPTHRRPPRTTGRCQVLLQAGPQVGISPTRDSEGGPLQDRKYKANGDKCEFARQEVEYLGHYVTSQGIRPLADKMALRVWPEPTNTTDVRSFMGLAGYYQRFITEYSRIAAPMTRLQSPKVPFVFDDDACRSFQALRTAMLMAPVLSIYDPTLPTRVTTDASGYGIGAVLEQHDGDDWHPVEYFSHKVPPINSLDDARKKELLAFVIALKRWRHFLLGRRRFTWVTDNNPLTYYKTQDTVSSTIGRWMYFIDQFDFTLKHLPGRSNRAADALSRRPDLCAMVHHAFAFDEELQRHFVWGYESDPDFATLYAQLSSDHPPASHYRIADGACSSTREARTYCVSHEIVVFGLAFSASTMTRDSLAISESTAPLHGFDNDSDGPTSLPMSLGIATLAKFADEASPAIATLTAKDIVSDHDTRFMSAFWTALMQESGTKMKPSSARHPQTDGQTERAHQTAQMMLRTLIRPDQKDWVDRLPDIEFAYNSSVHPAIGVTPFELHHGGRKGRIFADLLLPRPADIDAACSPASVRKYRELLAQARVNMQKAQVRMLQQANRRRVPCPIRAGDLVWVSAEEFCTGTGCFTQTASQRQFKLAKPWNWFRFGRIEEDCLAVPLWGRLTFCGTWIDGRSADPLFQLLDGGVLYLHAILDCPHVDLQGIETVRSVGGAGGGGGDCLLQLLKTAVEAIQRPFVMLHRVVEVMDVLLLFWEGAFEADLKKAYEKGGNHTTLVLEQLIAIMQHMVGLGLGDGDLWAILESIAKINDVGYKHLIKLRGTASMMAQAYKYWGAHHHPSVGLRKRPDKLQQQLPANDAENCRRPEGFGTFGKSWMTGMFGREKQGFRRPASEGQNLGDISSKSGATGEWFSSAHRKSMLGIRLLKGHKGAITALHFGGKSEAEYQDESGYFISGSVDTTVRLWNPETKGHDQQVVVMHGHNRAVRTIYSDKCRVVSGGDDKMVLVWDKNSGHLLVQFPGHEAKVPPPGLQVSMYFVCEKNFACYI
ncbi:hypothetical protein CBR_g37922 [Chara braunii]|uniref:Integrase catalytic domain-containing protein n=1 Tax=Chara braunii TaxID=69332 RepID=A0A388LP91_CHABU|nr:hypothetical protein CBR_g37922 [Chara braunii]|eukprot:GBG84045.1 hypothetical protein CBR_g37922 [Chara braunii]